MKLTIYLEIYSCSKSKCAHASRYHISKMGSNSIFGIAKDTAGFIKAHDKALNNYDFDTLVGGHLTRLGARK